MTARLAAAIAAGALAVGILVGAAATVLVGQATDPGWSATGGFSMPMMGGGAMHGMDVGDMAALHAQHHGADR